jgi:hypothetical protein
MEMSEQENSEAPRGWDMGLTGAEPGHHQGCMRLHECKGFVLILGEVGSRNRQRLMINALRDYLLYGCAQGGWGRGSDVTEALST